MDWSELLGWKAMASSVVGVIVGSVITWFIRGWRVNERIEKQVSDAVDEGMEAERLAQREERLTQREENQELLRQIDSLKAERLDFQNQISRLRQRSKALEVVEIRKKLLEIADLEEDQNRKRLLRRLGLGHLVDE